MSRLVGGDHFELFNGGNPVSGPGEDAGTPDITFFGNTPYVSWTDSHRDDDKRGFVGHFDAYGRLRPRHAGRHPPDVPARGGPLALIDARVALSSSCTADPFSKDGSACTPGDVNAAFHTFTAAGSPQRLFAQADIGGPNCVLFYAARWTCTSTATARPIIATLYQTHRVGIVVDRQAGHRVTRIGRVPLGSHQGPARACTGT